MKVNSKKNPPMSPKSELPGEGDMDRSSPILDDFDEELFIGLEEVGKELDRYKEESSKSHESEGGSHPFVVHRQPAFTYLHCLPHPPQDTSHHRVLARKHARVPSVPAMRARCSKGNRPAKGRNQNCFGPTLPREKTGYRREIPGIHAGPMSSVGARSRTRPNPGQYKGFISRGQGPRAPYSPRDRPGICRALSLGHRISTVLTPGEVKILVPKKGPDPAPGKTRKVHGGLPGRDRV
ncbi:hypothetical protein GWK47_053837 [Chionoecetes opilio]|uniref:Uncharacterized protein n=1 Tax=Chionoecetes opilio TaxID=41210 RepID=A0A8J5CQD6_CHIOP|nr:hypothetical protein GWK47_053837 [Chionoecetes opilio]